MTIVAKEYTANLARKTLLAFISRPLHSQSNIVNNY